MALGISQLAILVPVLLENGRLSPWWRILEEKSILVLGNSQVLKFSPWNKTLEKLHFGPSSLQIGKNGPREVYYEGKCYK